MATTKRSSRILDDMHETVRGLHNAGVISKRRMGEFEMLNNFVVHEMSPSQIKAHLDSNQGQTDYEFAAETLNLGKSSEYDRNQNK